MTGPTHASSRRAHRPRDVCCLAARPAELAVRSHSERGASRRPVHWSTSAGHHFLLALVSLIQSILGCQSVVKPPLLVPCHETTARRYGSLLCLRHSTLFSDRTSATFVRSGQIVLLAYHDISRERLKQAR